MVQSRQAGEAGSVDAHHQKWLISILWCTNDRMDMLRSLSTTPYDQQILSNMPVAFGDEVMRHILMSQLTRKPHVSKGPDAVPS
jgi:hypothetical protein